MTRRTSTIFLALWILSGCTSPPSADIGVARAALCAGDICYASDFGADPAAGNDDTEALQDAIHSAILDGKPLEIEVGVYEISDTLFIGGDNELCGPGGQLSSCAFISAVVRGEKTSFLTADSARIVAKFSDENGAWRDRPAINIQGARDVQLENLRIEGENDLPISPSVISTVVRHIEPDVDSWICSDCSVNRHSPYAGLVVDGYSGTEPTDPYPTERISYGAPHSSFLEFRNVFVEGFVVGVAINPSPDQANAENIAMERVRLRGNAYGLAIGGSQQRVVTFEDGGITYSHTLVTTRAFGAGAGQAPFITESNFGLAVRLFDLVGGHGVISFEKLHAEAFATLGNFGSGSTSAWVSGSIADSNINFFEFDYKPAFLFEHWLPMQWSNISFSYQGERPFSFFTGNVPETSFHNCTFSGTNMTSGQFRPFGSQYGAEHYTTAENSLQAFSPPTQAVNTVSIYSTVPARLYLSPNVREIFEETTRLTYTVDPRPRKVTAAIADLDYSDDEVVTFTASDASMFRVGDWLYWPAQSEGMYSGHPSYYGMAPALRVSAVDGASVTADKMLSDLISPITTSSIDILRPAFVNKTTATANVTSGSAVLTDVTSASNFIEGDWVQGAGLAPNSRIEDIAGNSITLSKAATASGSAVQIYNTALEL